MPTRNINFTERLDHFVDSNIRSGRYKSASEVVREGLRLLERQQEEDALRLKRLRDAVDAGEKALEHGDYRDVEAESLGDYLAELGETARRRANAG